MSPLHNRMAQDMRWPFHHRSVAKGHMVVGIIIQRRIGDGSDISWNEETGELEGTAETIYCGQARMAANKDWRARRRAGRADVGIQHAMRVQVPIRTCPPVHAYDYITVPRSPNINGLEEFLFHVRNVVPSGNAWNRNILCDVDVTHTSLFESWMGGD